MIAKSAVVVFLVSIVACSFGDDCLRACPRNFRPVCATYIKTYGNKCEMNAGACSLAQSSHVVLRDYKTQMCTCGRACPMNLGPFFCGTDGKNYENECMMQAAACTANTWIEKAADGPCSSVGVTNTRK